MAEALWSIPMDSDDGMQMVLPEELLACWQGASLHSVRSGEPASQDGSVIDDFARACAAKDPIDVIPVSAGFGVVLGSESGAHALQWLRVSGVESVFLVKPGEGFEYFESLVVERLLKLDATGWTILRSDFPVTGNHLILFAPCDPGAELELVETGEYASIMEGVPCNVDPGTYAVEYCVLTETDDAVPSPVLVCRFRPTSARGMVPSSIARTCGRTPSRRARGISRRTGHSTISWWLGAAT
jgi:hypothetical protein